ncbi:hypothetical protein Gotri_003370 [Gossypium trilobum]|uniref:Uncharacterized protein n=1 Tax=Gossypium trilobum TaxID=34281 RepID=A0A7J9F1B0_9ROSI|nr:hypothetical protein [Gossypium trilobum]MBA0779088.1 hypothetical protein [Gossypium trilobum]
MAVLFSCHLLTLHLLLDMGT